MSDKEIIKGIKASKESSFEELFRKYVLVLIEYASFYISERQIAEDIVQDLFVKIWESRNNLSIHTSLKSYLYRSTHNSCIQYLRHKIVSQKHEKFIQFRLNEARLMNQLYFESGINNLFEQEIADLVNKSLEKMPEKTSEIFLLSRKKFMRNAEIAKRFNLTEKSVEYHISKALEIMRAELKDYLLIAIILLMK